MSTYEQLIVINREPDTYNVASQFLRELLEGEERSGLDRAFMARLLEATHTGFKDHCKQATGAFILIANYQSSDIQVCVTQVSSRYRYYYQIRTGSAFYKQISLLVPHMFSEVDSFTKGMSGGGRETITPEPGCSIFQLTGDARTLNALKTHFARIVLGKILVVKDRRDIPPDIQKLVQSTGESVAQLLYRKSSFVIPLPQGKSDDPV